MTATTDNLARGFGSMPNAVLAATARQLTDELVRRLGAEETKRVLADRLNISG